MPSRSQKLTAVLVGLQALAWGGLAPSALDAGRRAAPAVTIRVGDFDGDGVLEMDDLQDAVDSLTHPGPKRIEVEPGFYAAPLAPASRPGRTHAILELPSHTTLACAGVGLTILNGPPPGPGTGYAVVANDDHVNGNDAVWIRSCEIDGGMPESYDSRTFGGGARMGVYFRRTRDSGVADSWVHHTMHTGLYTSNSSGDQFLRNAVEDAGGFGEINGRSRQPCIYLFAFGGGASVSDFVARDNTLRRCGHSGLNTRAEHLDAPGDAIRNLRWERNTVEQALGVCISLRGVEGALVRGLSCRGAGPIALNRGFGTGYRESGNDNANSDVTIEDAVVSDTTMGLDVGGWVDGLTLRRIEVEGTRDAAGKLLYRDCAWLERPLRRAFVEDLTLRDCGREGLVVTTNAAAGSGSAEETLALRRLRIEAVDQLAPLDGNQQAALRFVGPHQNLRLEDLELVGASAAELRFDGAVTNARLRRIAVDSVDPGWLGAFPESMAPACTNALEGRWLTSLDASGPGDCGFAPGTSGETPVRCGCLGGAWSALGGTAAPGIEFASGVLHSAVTLRHVEVRNARGATGLRVGGALSAFSVRRLLGADDGIASDLPQRSAADFEAATGWRASGVRCAGTQAGVPCVE
jgi:hypothetical protein